MINMSICVCQNLECTSSKPWGKLWRVAIAVCARRFAACNHPHVLLSYINHLYHCNTEWNSVLSVSPRRKTKTSPKTEHLKSKRFQDTFDAPKPFSWELNFWPDDKRSHGRSISKTPSFFSFSFSKQLWGPWAEHWGLILIQEYPSIGSLREYQERPESKWLWWAEVDWRDRSHRRNENWHGRDFQELLIQAAWPPFLCSLSNNSAGHHIRYQTSSSECETYSEVRKITV